MIHLLHKTGPSMKAIILRADVIRVVGDNKLEFYKYDGYYGLERNQKKPFRIVNLDEFFFIGSGVTV